MSRAVSAGIALVLLLVWAGQVAAILCEQCRGRVFDKQFGTCRVCKGNTHSTSFQYCPQCSAEHRRCEACARLVGQAPRAPDAPPPIDWTKTGTYQFGAWAYRLEVEGGNRLGRLAYKGKELPAAELNDHYRTPWGDLFFTGRGASGPRGWMPRPLDGLPRGKRLAPPEDAAAGVNLTEADDGREVTVYVGSPIVVQLAAGSDSQLQWRLAALSGDAVTAENRRPIVTPARRRADGTMEEGRSTFRLEAVQPGAATLRLELDRGFSAFGRPVRTFSVEFRVVE